MDNLTFIMTVEEDIASLSIEEYVDGMAEMVKSSMINNLQGSWQRAAQALINADIINWRGDVLAYPDPDLSTPS